MRPRPLSKHDIIRRHAVVASILLAVAAPAHATPGTLFDSHEPLAITLEAPLGLIAEYTEDEPGYHDARLRANDADLPLRVRARGKNRRRPDVCKFPPLRLNFASDTVAGTVFAGQDKLKLVTHCQRSSAFQQHVLREYLAYRLYNHITERSFRVRLLEVTYIDTEAADTGLTRSAFLIEDRDHMARRNGGETVKIESIERTELDPEASNLYELFQFMIGNTDWSIVSAPPGDLCCHNTVPIKVQPDRYIPVPYDFDNSGFVDVPYAAPGVRLPIDDVSERLYRGFCWPEAVLSASIEHFKSLSAVMFDTIDNQPGVSSRTRSSLNRYLNRFFKTIDNDSRRERVINRKCR